MAVWDKEYRAGSDRYHDPMLGVLSPKGEAQRHLPRSSLMSIFRER